MLLPYDLLYCLPWKSNFIKVAETKEITICVSDMVYGNAERTCAQIHLGIFHQNKLAHIDDIRGVAVADQAAIQFLECLENQIRTAMRKIVSWNQAHPDRQAIKIWYYNKSGSVPSAPASCLRMAVTMNGITPLLSKQELEVRQSLEACLLTWTHFLQKTVSPGEGNCFP